MLWLLVVSNTFGADTFIGSSACRNCHGAQFQKQRASSHAQALFRTKDHPGASRFSAEKLQRQTRYNFRIAEGHLFGSDDTDTIEVPMEWAFGAGRQAVTFVSRVNPEFYVEYFFSFYPVLKQFGITPGQGALKAATLPESVGILYKTDDPNSGIRGCFECHSTGPVQSAAGNELQPSETGVGCEACHGPASAHAAKPSKANILNLAHSRATEMNEACGKCHRPPASNGQKIDFQYAWNVRHQPVYLSESACFRSSKGALRCTTCHDPHGNATRDVAFYNGRCTGCHSGKQKLPAAGCMKNCVDCHMPLVVPQAPLRFANHWIGVYAQGSKLKPIARHK